MALGALIVVIDHTGVPDDEFDDWYDTEHLPQREVLPGFLNATRWTAHNGRPLSVGLYDLESVDAVHSVEYEAIVGEHRSPWTKRIHRLRDAQVRPSHRYECVQLVPGDQLAPADAGYLLLYRLNLDSEHEDDVNAWYNDEHLPALAAVPGVLCARRFVATNADDRLHRYVTTYHLDGPDVTTSPAWRAAAGDDRTTAMLTRMRDVKATLFAVPGKAQ